MPTGLIEQDDRVCTRGDFGCDLVEMELHGFAVAAGPALGADRTEQVRRGNVLRELKRIDEALASYDGALSLRPHYADALQSRRHFAGAAAV